MTATGIITVLATATLLAAGGAFALQEFLVATFGALIGFGAVTGVLLAQDRHTAALLLAGTGITAATALAVSATRLQGARR